MLSWLSARRAHVVLIGGLVASRVAVEDFNHGLVGFPLLLKWFVGDIIDSVVADYFRISESVDDIFSTYTFSVGESFAAARNADMNTSWQ